METCSMCLNCKSKKVCKWAEVADKLEEVRRNINKNVLNEKELPFELMFLCNNFNAGLNLSPNYEQASIVELQRNICNLNKTLNWYS